MKEIYLVRHGDVEYPTDSSGRKLLYGPDAHLSEVGKKQMEALAQKLPALDGIYTSPLPRAQKSADIVGKAQIERYGRDLTPIIQEELREPELGEWVGVLIDELEKNPNGYDLYSHPKLGQEPYEQVGERVAQAMRHIVKKLPLQCITVFVSHGEIVKISIFALEHSGATPPKHSNELSLSDQLKNGEAFRFVLDENNKVISKERITPF